MPAELGRLILGVLRKAGKPLATAEMTTAIVQELGHGPEAAKSLANRVRPICATCTGSAGL
jgi:hypothetical protein